jgi:hypothetical protein
MAEIVYEIAKPYQYCDSSNKKNIILLYFLSILYYLEKSFIIKEVQM